MRFVMVTWALTGVLLYHTYNSILISWLTQPSLKPLPQNAFETLEWPDKHYVIIKNSFAEEMLMVRVPCNLQLIGLLSSRFRINLSCYQWFELVTRPR